MQRLSLQKASDTSSPKRWRRLAWPLVLAAMTLPWPQVALSEECGDYSILVPARAAAFTDAAVLSLVSATLNAIIRGTVYVYAEEGVAPRQFDDTLVRQALKSRKR